MNIDFNTLGLRQRNNQTQPGKRYDTNGLFTCLTVSITEYDNPSVENRPGALKVRNQAAVCLGVSFQCRKFPKPILGQYFSPNCNGETWFPLSGVIWSGDSQ